MPRRSGRDAMLATFREESIDLLVERVRGGVGLVMVAIELWLRRPTLPTLLTVKGAQLCTVIAVIVALRRRPTWGGCVLLGLASMFTFCVTLGVSGVLTNEVASTPLLLILVTLVTGAF